MGPQAPMSEGSGNQLGARQWRNPEHCSAEPFIDNDITLPSARMVSAPRSTVCAETMSGACCLLASSGVISIVSRLLAAASIWGSSLAEFCNRGDCGGCRIQDRGVGAIEAEQILVFGLLGLRPCCCRAGNASFCSNFARKAAAFSASFG